MGFLMKDHTMASVRACLFANNMWGVYVGQDVGEATKKLILRDNKFVDNIDSDVELTSDFKSQIIQPWRAGWFD